MGYFNELLFGKPEEKIFLDDMVGEWKTVVRRDKPGKWCCWEAKRLLDRQRKQTYFSVSGDSSAPYASLLEQVYRVLANLDSITELAKTALKTGAPLCSIEDFYVSEVGDWDMYDDILQIGIAPIGDTVLDSGIDVVWSVDDANPNHRVCLHTVDMRIEHGQLIERGLA